ncbi:hypothetical protein EE612_008235 [Oryza sativa]|nr:hypothetical protein EE612_008235 [Oryza sativa]
MARTMTMRVSSLLVAVVLLAALSFQACSGHGGINDGDGQVDAPATPASSSGVRSKGLIAVKVWCLVILLVFTFAGGVSPTSTGGTRASSSSAPSSPPASSSAPR